MKDLEWYQWLSISIAVAAAILGFPTLLRNFRHMGVIEVCKEKFDNITGDLSELKSRLNTIETELTEIKVAQLNSGELKKETIKLLLESQAAIKNSQDIIIKEIRHGKRRS